MSITRRGEAAQRAPEKDTESIYITPGSFTGVVGDGGAAQAFELQQRDCDGAQFGPFDISFGAQWSSTNTQVVTLNGSDFNCVGGGRGGRQYLCLAHINGRYFRLRSDGPSKPLSITTRWMEEDKEVVYEWNGTEFRRVPKR